VSDQCFKAYRFSDLVLNGGVDRRPWSLYHYVTIEPRGNAALSNASIWNEPNASPVTYWGDWNPRSDQSAQCSPVEVGISSGSPVTLSFTRCEKWDITLGKTPGQFRNHWDAQGARVTEKRQIAYAVEVFVTGDSVPGWTLYAGHAVTR